MGIQEIEKAIVQLSSEDLATFTEWFEDFQAKVWDEQIAEDARAGRFDALIQRAREQGDAGEIMLFPRTVEHVCQS